MTPAIHRIHCSTVGYAILTGALLLVVAGCATIPPSEPVTPAPGPPPAWQGDLDRARACLRDGDPEDARAILARVLDRIWLAAGDRPGAADPAVRSACTLSLLAGALTPAADGDPTAAVPWWTPAAFDNPRVARCKERLLADGGRGVRAWARRAQPYLPDILRVVREEGLPADIWVLTLVESGFRHDARSRADALGPWQFLDRTARHAGMLVTVDRDERRDWVEATRGACRYLAELHDTFGDGLLALAAFNCGPYRVRRELAAAGTDSFWSLDLPRETEDYVPRALALMELLGDEADSAAAPQTAAPLAYDRVRLPYPVEVTDLARVTGVSARTIRSLNPAWLRPVTPGDGHPVEARVPAGAGDRVTAALQNRTLRKVDLRPGGLHRIKKGDTLWGISRHYHVKLNTLLLVNGLSGKEIIRPGRVLRVPG